MKNLRKYGVGPFSVAVIHGGPGAPGEMAPVAKELSIVRGILEPLQTSASIDGQLHELHTILKKHSNFPVTLVGHSWGAWLSFLFAARYPSFVEKLSFIGSGVFETKYALKITKTGLNRLNEGDKLKVHSFKESLNGSIVGNKSAIMAQFGKLMTKADAYDPIPFDNKELDVQYDIFQCVWKEAEELRQSGKLPEQGKNVQCPVVAIHGDCDSSPSEGDESHTVFVAENQNGEVVGYIAVHWLPYLMLAGSEGYISELFVRESDRGKGVGRKLLEVVNEQAIKRGCTRLMLVNGRNRESYKRGFYQKLGWDERQEVANFVLLLPRGA